MMATCEDIRPWLSDFADGDLEGEARAITEAHLTACPSCRGLLADLQEISARARTLGPIEPPDHVWLGIAGQLRHHSPDTHAPVLTPTATVPHSNAALWQWLGLAAALVLVTLTLFFIQQRPLTSTQVVSNTPGNAAPSGTVEAVKDELTLALQHYQNAITELEAVAKKDDGAIDPAVASVVQQNLGAIDRAIAESRTALDGEPTSEPARDSLFEALRQKVSVLQATVSLINQMRQGDTDGAARMTGRGKQS